MISLTRNSFHGEGNHSNIPRLIKLFLHESLENDEKLFQDFTSVGVIFI